MRTIAVYMLLALLRCQADGTSVHSDPCQNTASWSDGVVPVEHRGTCTPKPGVFNPVDVRTIPIEHTEYCPKEDPSQASERLGQTTTAIFLNSGIADVGLYWLKPDGGEHLVEALAPGKRSIQGTVQGYVFH